MKAAHLLNLNEHESGVLSDKRHITAAIMCCLNFNLIIVSIFLFGLLGMTLQNSLTNTNAEYISRLNLHNEKVLNEIKAQNKTNDWIEAKSQKYARYKISFPADGVIHAKGAVSVGGKSINVNIIEVNTKINPRLVIKPKTASEYLNSRVKIKKIAENNNVFAAVNGGFFKPQTGVPLGALVIDNELLTGPIYNRAAISINSDNTYSAGNTDFKFSLKNHKINVRIDNINQPRMLSTYVLLYTDKWGKLSPEPPKYGANAIIKNGEVLGIFHKSVTIEKGSYVLSAPEKVLSELMGQKNLKLNIKYPAHFKKARHIISGGPFLVYNGEIHINTNEEKLTSISAKNPRTLIGYGANNEFIMATIDGREARSVGMSLSEAANFMKQLGCTNAINLDGGSSSVMYLNGKTTNNPPVLGGIPISSALTIGLK